MFNPRSGGYAGPFNPSLKAWRCHALICLVASCSTTMILPSVSIAQSVCLPLPRLLTTMPMGGTVGTQVEIAITGESIEGAGELLFTHPGLDAVRKLDANGQPEANKYVVKIAADTPAGIHEARLMTLLGISSSRVFSVGTLSEVIQATPNLTLATAMELKVNSICNGVMSVKSIDHYTFDAQKGHRYVCHRSWR